MKSKFINYISLGIAVGNSTGILREKAGSYSRRMISLRKLLYASVAGYKSVLAKIYGTLSITGNQGAAGAPDIAGGLDEGSQVAFIRMFFNCWNCQQMRQLLHGMTRPFMISTILKWTAADPFLKGYLCTSYL